MTRTVPGEPLAHRLDDATGPTEQEIAQALLSHVHGGRSPEPVILRALAPISGIVHAIRLFPGRGTQRPTYALRIPALGLSIERQSVARVATRIHDISQALRAIPIGDAAPRSAPEYLVSIVNTETRVKARSVSDVRAAFGLFCYPSLVRIHAPVPMGEFEEACRTALSWSRDPGSIPDNPLRTIIETRIRIDQIRLLATEATADLPGSIEGELVMPFFGGEVRRPDIISALSSHDRLRADERLRKLARVLAADANGTSGAAAADGSAAARELLLRIRISTAKDLPDIRLRLEDTAGATVCPAREDSAAERRLDSASLDYRALLRTLHGDALASWVIDLSDDPGAPGTRFSGTILAEAIALGSPEGDILAPADLSRLLGRSRLRATRHPDRPMAFARVDGPG